VENLPLINLAYLAAAVLLIVGLVCMSRPRTAVYGNLLAAAGMAVAVVAAIFGASSYVYIIVGIVIGAAVGGVLAYTITTTVLPQMAALLNSLGAAASVLVAGGALIQGDPARLKQPELLVALALAGIIGSLTFSSSLVAYGKLAGLNWLTDPFPAGVRHIANIAIALLAVIFAALMLLLNPERGLDWAVLIVLYVLVGLIAAVLGVTLTNPIPGADLPVAIALLNSGSGLAAAATGFLLDNHVLIIGGSLVGASGIVLGRLMCKAMNRSFVKVLFGAASGDGAQTATDVEHAAVRATTAEDVALLLEDARRVVVVPGYGLALAQAQHAVRDLTKVLEGRGVSVEYAIHPAAGRIPGHMNVLLAEADIPYEQLKEPDEINPTLETVDVAIVIGANDVVNPAARTDPRSPLAGRPIIDVDKCRAVIVIKRSLRPGLAGVPNPLFTLPHVLLLYGDAQEALLDIVRAIKSA
jgi:NAD(P) transhydrogenase subunit beta